MNTGIKFKKVVPDDIQALVILVNSAYRGESSKKGWTTEADLLDGIRTDEVSLLDQINQPNQVMLKAVDEANNIIACVNLQHKSNKMYLGMLTVEPSLQTAGIGKQLLHAAESYSLEQGINVIEMTVISVRHELIAWYQRRGYQLTGEKRAFPTEARFGIRKQELEFVVLEKHLK